MDILVAELDLVDMEVFNFPGTGLGRNVITFGVDKVHQQ